MGPETSDVLERTRQHNNPGPLRPGFLIESPAWQSLAGEAMIVPPLAQHSVSPLQTLVSQRNARGRMNVSCCDGMVATGDRALLDWRAVAKRTVHRFDKLLFSRRRQEGFLETINPRACSCRHSDRSHRRGRPRCIR